MTLNLTMVLQADSAAAKAALDDTARGVKAVTQATEAQTRTSRTASGAADAEAAAKRRNAQASREMASANNQAAGATGNLVAQFNDIGMMLAAGQNPLQLAIQQGTQVAQVIGPMGAAGAARALGGAFMSMLSPINLVTLGVIALSGFMINWLTSSTGEAEGLNAQLERQRAAVEGIVAETEKLRLERGMMLSGAQTEDEQVVLEQINGLLAERKRLSDELEQSYTRMGRAAGTAGADMVRAKQDELRAQIADLDAKLRALDAQRELTAWTEAGLALNERMRSVMAAIGGADISGPWANVLPSIQAAIGMAQDYAAAIMAADARLAYEATATKTGMTGPDGVRAEDWGGGRFKPVVRGAGLAAPRVAGGGGGGGGAARDEASALQELIASLEGEIEALRVADPIQAEMLKHREALAGATEAERAKVEELIAAREREQLLMEGAQARAQFFEQIGTQALDALIMKGESFQDVLKGIIAQLIQAIAQAAIFGTGPFGSLFGGKSIFAGVFGGGGGGGLFGGGKAEGGMIYGPGTGTSDSIPTLLSNGEFVINARATARNRHLLEAINSGGRIPGFAEGGMVGGDRGRAGGRASALPAQIYMDLRGSNGDQAIEDRVRKGAARMISLYDREALPVSIQRVTTDQKRRG